LAAVLLFLSYIIGLLFTLRTHAAIIWSTDIDEKKPSAAGVATESVSPLDTRRLSTTIQPSAGYVPRSNIRETQLYKRILDQSLQQAGLSEDGDIANDVQSTNKNQTQTNDFANFNDGPYIVPPKKGVTILTSPLLRPLVPGLSEEDSNNLARQFAEMAATAATVAARDAVQHPRSASYQATHAPPLKKDRPSQPVRLDTVAEPAQPSPANAEAGAEGGGHDAPNWSRKKSSIILLSATVAYAIVAEVLVNTVDVVLENSDIDEKFLGITLFALVPNTTEFLNGISFAMNGNIALSMEIGSAYALQVCLLQVPALVLFSAVHGRFIDPSDLIDHTFNLIFPQWDMVTVILCVFLLSYMMGEGKSNYFKGSVLMLTYVVVIMGFYFSGYTAMEVMGGDPMDTLALGGNMVFRQGMVMSGTSTGGGGGGGMKKTEL
jgi:Ca2+:H+ antiporter